MPTMTHTYCEDCATTGNLVRLRTRADGDAYCPQCHAVYDKDDLLDLATKEVIRARNNGNTIIKHYPVNNE